MTTSERHRRAKELFLAACDRPVEERTQFLDLACGDDADLRRDVEDLLAFDPGDDAAGPPPRRAPEAVQDFVILGKLGEGGMGEVWEAEQQRPVRRRVALKLVKWGMDTKEVVARFEGERQALALMNHPNIAGVYQAGATDDGRPFFAMELIRGVPITEHCDDARLSTEERLELFIQVCDGVQHAHQKGLIHRDIKPTNVLVTLEDGRAVPKVIDFGVAKATSSKLTEHTLSTRLGDWIGTPEYMSPEQADLGVADIDTRSDVYALGVLLYELLAGARPFDFSDLRRSGLDEVRRCIREIDPPRPSSRVGGLADAAVDLAIRRRTDPGALTRRLRGDLDWIVMKALEKDRDRRYGSPAELAVDIKRHLRSQPVSASPPSTAYRLGKFVHRHRAGVVAGLLVMLVLVAGVVGTTVGLVRARRQAEAARQVSNLLAETFGAMNPVSEFGGSSSVEAVLDRAARRIDTELTDQPLVRARLKDTLGRAFIGLGRSGAAEPLMEDALEVRRQHLGDDHPDVANTLEGLASLSFNRGDYELARERLEQALEIRAHSLGANHRAVGTALSNLTITLYRLSRFDEAERASQRAIEILAAEPGEESSAFADALFNRQILLHEARRYEDAIEVCRRVVAIRERLLGPEHPGVGWALHDLGLIHVHAGDLTTGRTLLERSLEIHTRALGPDHWATSYPLDRLAELDSREGRFDSAAKRFQRALAIRRRALGEDHPEYAQLQRRFAHHLRRTGDPVRAEELLRKVLTAFRSRFGSDHLEVARTLTALAYVAYTVGDFERAHGLETSSYEIRGRLFRPSHRAVQISRYRLACLSAVQDRRRAALDHLQTLMAQGWADPMILDEQDFTTLRGDPEFEAVLLKVRRRLGSSPG